MSSQKQIVYTDKAMKSPLLSQATIHNGTIYLSGALGYDVSTNKLVEGTVTDRARQTILNVQAVLEEAGSGLENILKANIFLASMKDYAAVNKVYGIGTEMIPDPKPARTCVAVAELPMGTDVEIECITHL